MSGAHCGVRDEHGVRAAAADVDGPDLFADSDAAVYADCGVRNAVVVRAIGVLARGVDAATVPSRTTKTRVPEHGTDGDDAWVVPESVDFDLVESAGFDDRFDAVYARRLDRHANVETFLFGLAEIRGRDWTAAVAGDDPKRERIEATASDRRIDDRVSFLGDLPRRQRVEISIERTPSP